ncbi:MAG: hypothetical protein D6806_11485 [Deltaproteobacteria bacterium]|nr:MAG: hypothetical protein D6806_11485 [Deltaproteobacteria bacterium]
MKLRIEVLTALLLASLAIVVATCVYDFNVEGKLCTLDSSEHPCPPGFVCLAAAELEPGTGFCAKEGTDTDGGDGGVCTPGETKCNEDGWAVLRCQQGSWKLEPCPADTYCLFKGDEAGCVSECTSNNDCGQECYVCNQQHRCELQGNCSAPGTSRCYGSAGQEGIETCEIGGCTWRQQPCSDGQYCHEKYVTCLDPCSNDDACANLPDAESPEPNSCDLSTHRCVALNVCTDSGQCLAGQRCDIGQAGGVCMDDPTAQVGSEGGTPDLDCFRASYTPPDDTGSTTDCTISGNVFLGVSSMRYTGADGLRIEVHEAASLLVGDVSQPVASATISNGQYQTDTPVPARKELVLRIVGDGQNFVDTYTFGYYLRADDCDAGPVQFNAYAMSTSLLENYTIGGGATSMDEERGMVLVKVADCKLLNLSNARAGGALDAESWFYFVREVIGEDGSDAGGTVINRPEPSLQATSEVGWWGTANTRPLRGMISTLVLDSGTVLSLGVKQIRVFPHSASFFIYGPPRKPANQ